MSAETIDRDKIWQDFGEAVNMPPGELERWLQTEESKAAVIRRRRRRDRGTSFRAQDR